MSNLLLLESTSLGFCDMLNFLMVISLGVDRFANGSNLEV